jgi:hypothetical protein
MSDTMKQKAPGWFLVVAVVALLWNLLGVFAFIAQMTMSPEALAALPQDQQDLYTSMPTWATVAFAVAVNFGALGSLLLVLKKNMAGLFLQLSLAAVIVQNFHSSFMTNALEVYGAQALIMPVSIIIVAIYLVFLAAKAKRMRWTN